MTLAFPSIRRVVTGHDSQGRAVVASEGPLPTVVELRGIPGTVFHEVWSTCGTPAAIDNGSDPTIGPLTLPPPARGTRVRFVDIPPEEPSLFLRSHQELQAGFSEIGDAAASTGATGATRAPHPLMHRTETVDYGVVIEGEVILVLDTGEVHLKPGSVVVQRGTNHAWANRSGRPCRMLFVLVDGEYDAQLAAALRGEAAVSGGGSNRAGPADRGSEHDAKEDDGSLLVGLQWLAAEWCR